MMRIVVTMLSGGMLVLGTGGASGQAYPAKPIRIVAAEAGGSTDFTTRIVAQGISGPLGQPVIVENRTPYQGEEIVAKAQPDGYTLLTAGNALWLLPLMRNNVISDKVFVPITTLTIAPQVLIVNPSVPVKSVKDLIALAKSKPGSLNYASSTAGGPSHLAGELFNAMAGVKIVRIGYRSTSLSTNAVAGGEAQLAYISVSTATPFIRSGKVKAVAVSSSKPSPLAPDLPTIAASGLPGYELLNILGVFSLAKTPAAIIRRLNQEMVRVLVGEDVKEKFLSVGVEAVGGSPEQLATIIKNDSVRMGKVIKDAGIRDE